MSVAVTEPLDCVTSVCTLRDLDTWLLVSNVVPERISARRYRVIVPDGQVSIFREKTPETFEVHPESQYVLTLHDSIKAKIPIANRHRTGWYLQQFIKISSLINSPAGENHLIWDSDTLPLKQLTFLDI